MLSNKKNIAELKTYNMKAEYFLSRDRMALHNKKHGLPFDSSDIMEDGERAEFQMKRRANEDAIREIEFQESIGYSDYEDDYRVVRYMHCPAEKDCSAVGFCHHWKMQFTTVDEKDGKRKLYTCYYQCDNNLVSKV